MTGLAAQEFLMVMAEPIYPVTCGAKACAHVRCMNARETAARRCSECERHILPGERLIQQINPVTKALVSQRHETCRRES